MKSYETLGAFWRAYFNRGMTDIWTIVHIVRDGTDILVSMADPFMERGEDVFVRNVGPNDLTTLITHYKERFLTRLPERFGFYKPTVDRVLTEYPDWQSFYDAWLADDATLVQANMPLLFDYPSADEYRVLRLKAADPAGYRRLLVVLYQYRRQSFQLIFIKNVDDIGYQQARLQIDQLYRQAMPMLILKDHSDA